MFGASRICARSRIRVWGGESPRRAPLHERWKLPSSSCRSIRAMCAPYIWERGCVARLGRRKTALAWGARALGLDGEDSAVQYNVGCLYAILGRSEEAVSIACCRAVYSPSWPALLVANGFVYRLGPSSMSYNKEHRP